MGEALYEFYDDAIRPMRVGAGTRIYAPVGSHEDLLAYLVRRLLENGANTSFVNRLGNDKAPLEGLIADPGKRLAAVTPKRNPRIAKPENIFPDRRNSSGFLLSDPVMGSRIVSTMRRALENGRARSYPIIGGVERVRPEKPVLDPANRRREVGMAGEAAEEDVRAALDMAVVAQAGWDRYGGASRASILERAADLFEERRALLMGLIVREAGRTIPNALLEIREAVDLLRYYAKEARAHFEGAVRLPAITGESNSLTLRGRGVFACIAPWNFPLSIFTGQVAAALAAGNSVLAKPAEQTPSSRPPRFGSCTKWACPEKCCISSREMGRASGRSCSPIRV